MPAQDFPFYWPYKNSNRINLNFGVTIVAVDLMLLMKIEIKLPIITVFTTIEKNLDTFCPKGYCAKTNKDKKFNFSVFQSLDQMLKECQ